MGGIWSLKITPENTDASNSARRYRPVATIAVLAVLYFVAGRLGLLLAIPPGYATAIFPSAGLALAALLLYGYRVWPGVLLGSLVLNLSMAPPSASVFGTGGLVALAIAVGAASQALAGAALIRHFVGRHTATLADAGEIFRFFMLGGPVSCLVNSLIGSNTLLLAGAISADALVFNWWTWWIGDVIGVFIATPLVFIALARPRDLWRARLYSVALPLLLTLIVVIAVFIRASSWENQKQRADFQDHTEKVTSTLRSDVQVYVAIVASVERLFAASSHVSRQQYATFVKKTLSTHPGLQALSWLPVVKDAKRADFEYAVQAEGFGGFQIRERNAAGELVKANTADEYAPVAFIEPYEGNNNALGFNVASTAVRLQALQRARDNGVPVATGRITLVQETGQQFGFLLIFPVYNSSKTLTTANERTQELRGYATAVMRMGDMLGSVAQDLDGRGIALRILDEAAPAAEQLLYQSAGWDDAVKDRNVGQVTQLEVGGRVWRLEFMPLPAYLASNRAWQAWTTLAGGLLFAGLLGALLLLITGSTGKIQQVVAERTHELRIILDNVVDGILTFDEHGTIQSFNRAAETIYGYKAAEVIGRNASILLPEDGHGDHVHRMANYRQTEGTAVTDLGRRELVARRKDGSNFPIDVAISRSSQHDQPLFIGVVRDITERRRVDRMKSEFVSTVSHELRTPLTSIVGALGLLAGGAMGEMTDKVQKMIGLAHKNGLRLAALIDDLLDMEKMVAGKMTLNLQRQPLMPLIDQTLETIRAYGDQFEVKFRVVSREDLDVLVDAARLIQVLNNFLSNAAKFSPRGGQVEVAVQRLDTAVRVEVIDHGPGIPEKFRARMFQKFSQADSSDTREKSGTGLGLAISKELVERMHGRIGFESVEGQGASFYFELPL